MPRYATQPKPAASSGKKSSKQEGPTPSSASPPHQPTLHYNNRELVKAEFARRLWEAIMQRGWTQSEFARYAGLNRDAVSTYVRGKSFPSPQSLEKMSQLLGVKPEDLLPNYYEMAQAKQTTSMELRAVPNEEGYMWLKLDLRLPKKLATEIFLMVQDHA